MASGFGVDPTLNGSGVPTSGTSAQDIRKIQGALYKPGIISGSMVTTSPSAMTYTVGSGVAAISTATGEIVLAPVPAVVLTTAPAPSSGTRTDIVYVQQRYPGIEGDSSVVVNVGTTLPARALQLKRFTVSAGQTNTNAAIVASSVDFSIPYGATMGQIYYYQYTASHDFYTGLQRFGQGTISVPTDRRLRFGMHACMSAIGASGFDQSKYCEYGFLPNIDGGDFVIWTTPGLHQAWQTVSFFKDVNVGTGTHTVNLGSVRMVGPGNATLHYGLDGQGFGRAGLEFFIDDLGPAI